MKLPLAFAAAAFVAIAFCQSQTACAQKRLVLDGPEATRHDLHARWNANRMPWHAPYANTTWGWPVALVVPPTAHMQTHYSWGVPSATMTPIYHQFGPSAGNPTGLQGPPGYYGGPLLPTPYWPSHTDQFGVYYVRAPY
jgi:hypothetical protein